MALPPKVQLRGRPEQRPVGRAQQLVESPQMTDPRTQPLVDPRMLRLLGFEDLHLGMRESLMKTVVESDVVGFARLSGDDNPLHLCDVYASETRFGQRIAHGLYTASLISAVLGTRLPEIGRAHV